MNNIHITEAKKKDLDAIWNIFKEVVEPGDAYSFPPGTTREEMEDFLTQDHVHLYLAYLDDEVTGFYYIKPNTRGLGAHICNADFMVHLKYQGKGVGRAMGFHALEEAKKLGFMAMQFNLVVSTNERALGLWKSLGFHVVGSIPKAFHHRSFGMVDAFIMHRHL